MNRRDAIALLLAFPAATQETIQFGAPFKQGPMKLVYQLDHFSALEVEFKGETISITPAEIFAALKVPK